MNCALIRLFNPVTLMHESQLFKGTFLPKKKVVQKYHVHGYQCFNGLQTCRNYFCYLNYPLKIFKILKAYTFH